MRDLHLDDDQVDDVALVCTELVTNVVLHTAGPVSLTVRVDGTGVLVEVSDDEPTLSPERHRSHDLAAESGRGLTIVEAISSSWGVRCAGRSKTVWAHVDFP
ncbi:hypothetical protein GCM10009867_25710 [Pedococcus aerophilus]|uniref:Histidine kinase/HSP90-like ATPase domain-containing protein n=2 Tax=Pedococcus aerophilus TaxID=436356 RepID=A0ABN3URN9_9MICO